MCCPSWLSQFLPYHRTLLTRRSAGFSHVQARVLCSGSRKCMVAICISSITEKTKIVITAIGFEPVACHGFKYCDASFKVTSGISKEIVKIIRDW